MAKILALVDGSIYAESVAGIAAWAAGRLALPVEAAHVLGRRMVSGFDLSGNLEADERGVLLQELAELDAQHGKVAQQKGRIILDAAETLLRTAGVAEVSTKLRNGDLLEMLTDLEADAEMIVIGKRGEAADFAKSHLGSNVERVVRAASKPVLVAARAYKPFNRVLIAYDGGKSISRAVGYIADSPLLKGMECTLLSVAADTSENRSRLDAPAAQLRQAGFSVDIVVESGEPDDVIGNRVEADGIGLLVMGAYGHSRIRRLIIGSTTTAMVRRCKIPVLMFRE